MKLLELTNISLVEEEERYLKKNKIWKVRVDIFLNWHKEKILLPI